MSYLLGMLGPINVADFREYLYADSWHADLPKGLGGTPVNLLSRELLERGHKLVIFTLDPSVQNEVVLKGENLTICIGPFRRARHRALDFFAVERKFLAQTIKREMPDILHAQWTYEYALAAQSSGLPHVITAHDAPISIVRLNFTIYRIIRTFMAYWVLGRAKRVVSVSPYVANHLRRWMFYRGSDEVISNGLSQSIFDITTIPRRNDASVTFATILNGWGEYKNGHLAVRAFAKFRQANPKSKLLMIGAGHGQGEPAELWASAHAFDEGIEFIGKKNREWVLEKLASNIDILIHPSLEESHGIVLIEAMALGIPTIGGVKSGAVPWTLDDGRAGILVDVTSADAIAGAMTKLATNFDERIEWGFKGKEMVKKRFHIKTIADAYEKVYCELAETK
jgi:glycosyltransferase involved in cell wall biosynthesis